MNILICDGLAAEAVAQLKAAGHAVDLRKGITKDELLTAIPAADCVVVRSATKITADVIERGRNLKLVCRGGVGLDNVDRAAAEARGITVRNTPNATSISVAEHALGLMLALARHIPQACASVKSGVWDRKSFTGTELYGKTLGVVGFGRIGRELANRALALGMKVVACDPVVDPKVIEEMGHKATTEFGHLLGESDYVSLHMPITTETERLINRDTLAQMKKGAYLINTARGGLLDETAVADALRSGQLRGVALDVYRSEPPPADHPLIGLPQVIAVPHIGASTDEGQTRAGLEVAQIICDFAAHH